MPTTTVADPITIIYEQVSSRRATVAIDRGSQLEWKLRLIGSDILDNVIEKCDEVFPEAVYEPAADLWLVPKSTQYEPLGPGHAADTAAAASWDVTRMYVDPADADNTHQLKIGELRLQRSSTGGSVKVLTSIDTLGQYKRSTDPLDIPDFKNAIGVTRDNEVQGVDKVVPNCRWTISARFPHAVVTGEFLDNLDALTGTINDGYWWDQPPYSVAFLGYDTTLGPWSDPTIDFHFSVIQPRYDFDIGDIHVDEKGGQDYLWGLFEESPQSGAGYMPAVPRAVYVEQIYYTNDFAELGIGLSIPDVPPWPPES
jgi:hypothetical protein